MTLSIITITFNNCEELKRTLGSIPPFEFIESVVVNGGSSPDTLNYMKSRKGKVINEPDKGIADAFNKGVKASTGDLIMFLNSGDILINPAYLNQAADIFEKEPGFSFVHSNILYSDTLGGELLVKPVSKNFGRGMKYLHPTMIVRKRIFDEIGLFNLDYKISMDFDFALRMEKKGLKGFYIDGAPAVKMEGEGKSNVEEFSAIKECIRSLKVNKFITTGNLLGLLTRLLLFSFRRVIMAAGGKKILGSLKRLKYNLFIW